MDVGRANQKRLTLIGLIRTGQAIRLIRGRIFLDARTLDASDFYGGYTKIE